MNKYQELIVWQKAMDYVVKVYEATSHFPATEKYGLVTQMNRAAVSIPSNIAEGAGRNSKKEFLQFLSIATGSAYELETQLMLAKRISLLTEDALQVLNNSSCEIQKMISGLQKSLRTSY